MDQDAPAREIGAGVVMSEGMFTIDLDMRVFEQKAREMRAAQDQVPYALSLALNDAAKATRFHEVDKVWPRSVTVRNRSFIRAALRTEFASKRNLSVAIFDSLGRGHLKLHDKGGTKQARGKLAIPTSRVRRGSRGVIASQKPGALRSAFREGDSIFQRLANGKRALMFSLRPTARIKADVPFSAEFSRKMREEMRRTFGPAMMKAMKSRR